MKFPGAPTPRKKGAAIGRRKTVKKKFGEEGAWSDAPGMTDKNASRRGKHRMTEHRVKASNSAPTMTLKAMQNTECGARVAKGVECTRARNHKGPHQAYHPSARNESKLRRG